MPRYDLYDRPWYRNTSPGASSVPASRLPIITAVRPGRDRLDDVARGAHAAIGDRRHAALAAGGGGFQHRGELRHADAGDDARGADAARADADLHRVRAGLDQRQRALGRGDVAGDHLHRVGQLLDRAPPRPARRRSGRARYRPRSRPPRPRSAPARARCAVRARRRWRPRRAAGPSSSLLASGCACALSMSLTVISPTQR